MDRGRLTGNSPDRTAPEEVEGVRLLVVKCGPYRLGVPAGLVRAVVGASDVVPLGLPGLPGLIWMDGALIPAIGLAPLLGLLDDGGQISGHGVLVRSKVGSLCFMVDDALDLVEASPSSILPLPPLVAKATALSGLESAALVNGLLLIVDPVLVLGRDRAADLVSAAARIGESSGSPRSLV